MNRKWQAVAIVALSLTVIVGALAWAQLGLNDPNKTRCSLDTLSALAAWLGCAMAAHENLAGGLIGATGTLFAGWLAYSAVQEQIRIARAERTAEERTQLRSDLDSLKLAVSSLKRVADHFPEDGEPAKSAPFAMALIRVSDAARLQVGTAGSRTPEGFGARFQMIFEKLNKLADQIEKARAANAHLTAAQVASNWEYEVREQIMLARFLANEISERIPDFEERVKSLERSS